MSLKVLQYVWEHSQQKGSYLVTMLAIADYAHDDGTRAYPSIGTLARKTRMTERNVQLVLRKLEADGELIIQANTGPRGCNMYTIPLSRPATTPQKHRGETFLGENEPLDDGCNSLAAGGVKAAPKISPNPSLDPSERQKDPGISSYGVKRGEPMEAPAPDPASVSPYELSQEIQERQAATGLEGVRGVLAALWPSERERQVTEVPAPGCRHESVDAAGVCNACREILEPAAAAD